MKKFQLREKEYALYVGALQPRKNLTRLIRAFERAKEKSPDLRLVLAGEPAWLSREIINKASKSQESSDIILTGRVSFEELRVLYQSARVFVFPSLYEGFGLPILEAFAAGVPVLTARNSSLTEVAGEGALFVQAEEENDIEEKLLLLWNDEKERENFIQKGKEELARFSWNKTAESTLDFIRS